MRTTSATLLAIMLSLGAFACAAGTDAQGGGPHTFAAGNGGPVGSAGSDRHGQAGLGSPGEVGGIGANAGQDGAGGVGGGVTHAKAGDAEPAKGDTGGANSGGGGASTGLGGGKSSGSGGGKSPDGGKSTEGGGASTSTSSDGAGSSSDTATIPGNGCTPPQAYANLFVGLSGHTQAETDAKLSAAWSQLFSGKGSNTIYYDGPGSDESYVEDIGNGDVRTEGMSYGMMISVQLDHQTEFDRLWTWVKKHMANGTGQIAWQCSTSGSKMSNGGAPDGEEYFATALIFASKRWGNSGKYNYASEAQWVLNSLRTTYFNSSAHIVQFVAGSGNTDGSYILPAFYQVWACFDTANASYWNSAITAGRSFFHSAIDSNGVIGDQSSFTGQTTKAAGPDTIRCVANIMMDHNFFNADPWQTETYATKYGTYVSSHGQNSTAATSCNGLLGFGLPESSGKSFVDKLWSTPIPTGQWRYYDGCWYLMAMLHVGGAFKLWY